MKTKFFVMFFSFITLFLFTVSSHAAIGSAGLTNEADASTGNKSVSIPKAEQSVTQHKIVMGGVFIPYTATAGTLIVRNEKDLPYASMGYIAYTRNDVANPGRRPITFAYNGGPGCCSVPFLYAAGFQPVEVTRLETDSYDPPSHLLTVTGRRGHIRQVSVTGGTAEALDNWLIVRGPQSGPMFIPLSAPKGDFIEGAMSRRMNPATLCPMVMRRAADAGIGMCIQSDLQCTGVEEIFKAGRTLVSVQQTSRHAIRADCCAAHDGHKGIPCRDTPTYLRPTRQAPLIVSAENIFTSRF